MTMASIHLFLMGAATVSYFTVVAFFLRFWQESRDRLFLLFGIAFAAMGVNRGVLVFVAREHQPYLYVIRLIAFLIIAFAVVDKNRR